VQITQADNGRRIGKKNRPEECSQPMFGFEWNNKRANQFVVNIRCRRRDCHHNQITKLVKK